MHFLIARFRCWWHRRHLRMSLTYPDGETRTICVRCGVRL